MSEHNASIDQRRDQASQREPERQAERDRERVEPSGNAKPAHRRAE